MNFGKIEWVNFFIDKYFVKWENVRVWVTTALAVQQNRLCLVVVSDGPSREQ